MIIFVVGLQWGDEGKAKVVHYLTKRYSPDYVIRYQGGANAGHTVVFQGKKIVFHLIPSGVIHNGVKGILGNGMVIDLEELLEELKTLESLGINVRDRIFISDKATVVLPYHKLLDKIRESKKGKNIGTTLRGIGPAYEDKYARKSLRIADIVYSEKDSLRKKLREISEERKMLIEEVYKEKFPDIDDLVDILWGWREEIKGMVYAVERVLYEEVKRGKSMLFEGAQGVLLDVDFGTYPFVTSSNPIPSGSLVGTGIPFSVLFGKKVEVIGVLKAYTTRVGEGPFPTEMKDEEGRLLREKGGEFGATTGRPRRCGWLDLILTKYSSTISGINSIFLTKLDVLTGFKEIKIATSYLWNGVKVEYPTMSPEILPNYEVQYTTLEGWETDLSNISNYEDLPENVKRYIEFIEEYLEVPVKYISVSPETDKVIER